MEEKEEDAEASGSEVSVCLQSILPPRRGVLPSPEAGGLRGSPSPRCSLVPSADGPGWAGAGAAPRALTSWSWEEGTNESAMG